MDDTGWIKIHRKLRVWEWADCPEMMCVWIHLLLDASYEDNKWHGMTIKRGQVVIGREKFSAECGVSVRTLRTCIDRLVECGQITKESTNRFTIITICKYEDYQMVDNDERPTNDHQMTNKRPSNDQQTTTTKEIKKEINKERKNNISLSRACDIDGASELALYWNAKINVITKFVDTHVDSNPSRMYRLSDMIETYGMERMKIAIDNIAKNQWLLDNANFDWLTEGDKVEKINAGYYEPHKKNQNNGNNQRPDRLHPERITGPSWSDF